MAVVEVINPDDWMRWNWPNSWKDVGEMDPDENKGRKLTLSTISWIGIIIGLGLREQDYMKLNFCLYRL